MDKFNLSSLEDISNNLINISNELKDINSKIISSEVINMFDSSDVLDIDEFDIDCMPIVTVYFKKSINKHKYISVLRNSFYDINDKEWKEFKMEFESDNVLLSFLKALQWYTDNIKSREDLLKENNTNEEN